MTDHARAIEAGARAVWDCELSDGDTVGTLIYNSDYVVPASRDDMHAQAHIICETISDAVIKAAIASGALVPASAVAAERERCAAFIRSWTNHSKMQLHAGEMTAQEKRTTEAVLNAIERQVSALPAPASGEFVVGWRDIASAPLDIPVDLICQDVGGEQHRFCDAVIRDRNPHVFTFGDTSGTHTYWPHENGMWVTHWMPAPALPMLAAATKDGRGS